MNILGHFFQKVDKRILAECLDVVRKFRRHLLTEFFAILCATFFAAATPVFKPALLEVEMRLVPENRRNVRVADNLNPLVHVRAEFGMVRACGDFRLSVYRDLAHVVVSRGKFRISFAAEHATDAPRIHIDGETHRGGLVHDLFHRAVVVL